MVPGPVAHVGLLDATWQGEPEWGNDPWVAVDSPDFAHQGPPYPGALVRAAAEDDSSLRVAVSTSAPHWAPTRVLSSELVVGGHGLVLLAGRKWRDIEVAEGNYPLQVWVDAVSPGRARAIAFVLGAVRPRRLSDRPK